MTAAELRTWLDALLLAENRLTERLSAIPEDRRRRTADQARDARWLTELLGVLHTGGNGAGYSMIDAFLAADVDVPERPNGAWYPLRSARRKLRELEGKAA